MRLDPGNCRFAAADNPVDHGTAHLGLAAVKTVDAPVAVARLSTPFSLNGNPRLDFRTHSNPINWHPLPGARPDVPHPRRRDAGVDKGGAGFAANARAGLAKLNWRVWG